MKKKKGYSEDLRKENAVENKEINGSEEEKSISKSEKESKKPPQLSMQILDGLLILAENMLAFRVVVSFLGGGGGDLIYKITNPLLVPFSFLQKFLTLKADNSILELIPIVLVFALAIIHSYFDRKVFYA